MDPTPHHFERKGGLEVLRLNSCNEPFSNMASYALLDQGEEGRSRPYPLLSTESNEIQTPSTDHAS